MSVGSSIKDDIGPLVLLVPARFLCCQSTVFPLEVSTYWHHVNILFSSDCRPLFLAPRDDFLTPLYGHSIVRKSFLSWTCCVFIQLLIRMVRNTFLFSGLRIYPFNCFYTQAGPSWVLTAFASCVLSMSLDSLSVHLMSGVSRCLAWFCVPQPSNELPPRRPAVLGEARCLENTMWVRDVPDAASVCQSLLLGLLNGQRSQVTSVSV